MTDEVNNPSHYNQAGIQVIDVIEIYAKDDFRLANVLKYVCRCEYKGKKLQDLEKAQWYLNRVVDELLQGAADDELSRGIEAGTYPGTGTFVNTAPDRIPEDEALEDDSWIAFNASLATRIAGETPLSEKIKDEYYDFDRFEIQGYCGNCDAEISKGQPFITSCWFDLDLKFCSARCVDALREWQKSVDF